MPTSAGPWPDLDGLPGVADAVDGARSAIAAVRRLPGNRQGWARTAAAAGIRSARASAMLDGGSAVVAVMDDAVPDGDPAAPTARAPAGAGVVTDPILAGALRVSAAIGELAPVWRRAPLQALARLHTLAAADLVDADDLGRPQRGPGIGERLTRLANLVVADPWSAPVLVAVVHGELLTVRAFGSADGVVARAAARLAMVTSGLDPQALTAPDVGFLRAGPAYRRAADGFATGEPAAVAAWICAVCAALRAGAREARSIATAAGG